MKRILLALLLTLPLSAQQWPAPFLIDRTEPYTLVTRPGGLCQSSPNSYGCVLSPADYLFAVVWVGAQEPIPDTRVYVTTSSFDSFTSTAAYPWDIAGDYQQHYALWQLQPWVDGSGHISDGYRVVPIARRKFRHLKPDGTGEEWLFDTHMRVWIHLSPPGCGIPVCGAITALPRTDVAVMLNASSGKVRAVRK